MSGRLVAVVGPSGAGKDSLIAGLAAADPRLVPVRRVVTRPADATEPFLPVSEAAFARMVAAGAFALHWRAHGLGYGIPVEAAEAVAAGGVRLANLSRGVLAEAAEAFPAVTILSVTVPEDVLAERLARRGRETRADIAARLARPRIRPPEGIAAIEVDNGGSLVQAVTAALAALSEVAP